MRRRLAAVLATCTVLPALVVAGAPGTASALPPYADKHAVAVGAGGAAATVDPLATEAALRVLRAGGNAIDAAVAAAAVLTVTEPYSCGIGGGGFLVAYLAGERRVVTVDHRELSPAAMRPDSFVDPATGQPIPFGERVTSGLGVGVPGTLAGWDQALRRWGTRRLDQLLRPAIEVATHGFEVDQTFTDQTVANLDRFRDFTSTRATFLTSDGSAPAPGSRLRNVDYGATLREIARDGVGAFYAGPLAHEIVRTVATPPLVPGSARRVRPGAMTVEDLRGYESVVRAPTATGYRGFEVYGMGPPSSGGSTVGEALNILEGFDLRGLGRPVATHYVVEAARLAFADRNAYLGDPDHVDVPLTGLLSDGFAAERRALVTAQAGTSPAAPGDPYPYDDGSAASAVASGTSAERSESTTHLTVSDRWGNVVSYTFTIESTGGSGIVVPGRGFLLNNELTDFEPVPGLANSPGPRKRPRSSMSPTIVLRDGAPVLALGSPGGSTIITTVLHMLVDVLDHGLSLPQAIAAPRLTQRNTPATLVEEAFASSAEAQELRARGHRLSLTGEIGAATGIALLPSGLAEAAAEPVRRGGGSAGVVRPADAR